MREPWDAARRTAAAFPTRPEVSDRAFGPRWRDSSGPVPVGPGQIGPSDGSGQRPRAGDVGFFVTNAAAVRRFGRPVCDVRTRIARALLPRKSGLAARLGPRASVALSTGSHPANRKANGLPVS